MYPRLAIISFILANLLLIGGGVGHFSGQFGGKESGPPSLVGQMQAAPLSGPPGSASVWDVMQAWGVGMGIELVWVGVLGIVVSSALASRPIALRAAALLNAAGVAALMAAAVYYRIFPPPWMMAPPLVLFLVTAFTVHRRSPG